jgi:tripartite-type tricarboxylate transporter receptor subunit TctC
MPQISSLRRACSRSAALALLCLHPLLALAQPAFPTRPVAIVIPYAAGGSTDTLVRYVAKHMETALKQSVVVDNKGGGNGIIGTTFVARAKPDGYTILTGTDPVLVLNPLLYKDLPYSERDFRPVTLLVSTPLILAVAADAPIKSVRELVDRAKARPGEVNFGSPGTGGVAHLTAEYFAGEAGFKLTHIPFAGGGPAMQNLMGGHIQALFTYPSRQLIESSKIRILAVAAAKRVPSMPDVPTFAEAGFPGINVQARLGLVAPAGTPEAVIGALETAANAVITDPEFRKAHERLGYIVPDRASAADFGELLAGDSRRWKRIITDRNVVVPQLK